MGVKYLKIRYLKSGYSLWGCHLWIATMPKAIYRPEHDIFLAILKARRIDSGMTQADCSHALGRPQSFMSDVERGVRRLDIIQIRDLCEVLGCALIDLIQEFENSLNKAGY